MNKNILMISLILSLTACAPTVLKLNSGTPAQYKINCEMSSNANACKQQAEILCPKGYRTDDVRGMQDIMGNDIIEEMYITCH